MSDRQLKLPNLSRPEARDLRRELGEEVVVIEDPRPDEKIHGVLDPVTACIALYGVTALAGWLWKTRRTETITVIEETEDHEGNKTRLKINVNVSECETQAAVVDALTSALPGLPYT